jgi:hypothetical protein
MDADATSPQIPKGQPARLGKAQKVTLAMTKTRVTYIVSTVFVLLLVFFGCRGDLPVYYRSPTVSGTVVDKKTGKPLAGVSVTVTWSAMRSTGNTHNPDWKEIKSGTTETDTNGVFTIPKWGPVTLTADWYYYPDLPTASFSKSGQKLGWIWNRNEPTYHAIYTFPFQIVTFERPSWDGQKIPF